MKAPKTMRFLKKLVHNKLNPLGYMTIIIFLLNMWSVSAQSITGLEYYFGTDPGVGSGTQISANANTGDLTQTLNIPLTGLDQGFHRLTIRAKDHVNTWGLYKAITFYISEAFSGSDDISNLAAAEYWFNTDPGPGNGTTLAITGNPDELTEGFAIPLGTLDVGFHQIGLRVQNLDGNWSLYDRVTFYISEDISGSDPVSNLAAAEYWFDADPGPGNGTALAITGNPSELTENFVIPLGTLESGYHEIGLRTQNLDGTWSLYDRKTFYLIDDAIFETDPVSPLTDAEFLLDAELGFGTGTAIAITPTENPDEYVMEIPTDMVTCDIHDMWLSVKNDIGNYALYKIADEIDVYDDLAPTIVVYSDITVSLDASGQGSITLDDVNNGTFDDCELVSVVLNQEQFDYTCTDLGENTVTITATDAEDKVSTQEVTITVVDTINPVAVSQDITVQLDANGEVTITPSQIENGSTDNCSIVSSSLDVSTFDCSHLGENTVTFTVEDADGNTNTTTAMVTIEDTVNPTVITQNISIELDATGNASIAVNDIDNNSTDNCTTASSSLDLTSFTCANLGENTVTLTLTDQSNNTSSETAIVTVVDAVNPTVIAQNISIQLDANGTASITAAQIENGSSDNCTISSSSLDISSFTCDDLGDTTVTLSVTDQSNNTGTATAIVTVEDAVSPTAITQNVTIQLDANGTATLTPSMVDHNSTDNCSISSTSLDLTSFTCDDIGDHTVTLTVTDQSNNTDSETAIVTVVDAINPTVATQNMTIQLDANGNASITTAQIENGSSDNCTISSSNLDISNFTCDDIGDTTVTLSVTDQSNNIGTATAIVTVEDTIAPTIIGQDITRDLAGASSVTILASDVDNGSSDNCDFSLSLDTDTFTMSGVYTVTLTITDSFGNTDSVDVTVTITDSTLGIAEFDSLIKQVKVYPNPVKDKLNIATDLEIKRIEIYDVLGKKISHIEGKVYTINTINISNGTYFLKIYIDNQSIVKRFIKQ